MKEFEMSKQTIGEIVANDYRTAGIFSEAGIDFCCGGNKNLEEACKENGIDQKQLMDKLESVRREPRGGSHNFNEWDPAFLCQYIINVHHGYVRKNLPGLVQYTGKIAGVHGEHHPELSEVATLFSGINEELIQHMKREEEVLFPAIEELFKSGSDQAARTISSEIRKFSDEHESAGGAMDRINQLTGGYRVPADACNTYKLALKMLREFEDDLHTHVHLENNILFPKSIKLAKNR